jgi:hypothetical protein
MLSLRTQHLDQKFRVGSPPTRPLIANVGQPADSSQRSTVSTPHEFNSSNEELLWRPKS